MNWIINNSAAPAQPNMLFLLILLIIPIGIVMYMRKKKKDKEASIPKQRKEGDEVWKTVKDFLKQNDETGKEIIETYVAKRPDPNIVDKTKTKEEQKKQKEIIKQNKTKIKQEKQQAKKDGKIYKAPLPKDIYVVWFKTKNCKTNIVDEPRIIECEVKMIKINKYDSQRKIVIHGEKDYETESKWVLPLKEAEEIKLKKEMERYQKAQKRKEKFNFFKKKRKKTKNNKKG